MTGSADILAVVPIYVSASALEIANETKRHLDFSSSFITTFISQSANVTGSLYGMVITNRADGGFNDPTGSTHPTFTFQNILSGSISKVPRFIGDTPRSLIRVQVTPSASVRSMISQSVLQINSFSAEKAISASYIPTSHSTFLITNLIGGEMNAPTHDQARGILTSTLVSGSGNKGAILRVGTPDIEKAVAQDMQLVVNQ